MIDQNRDGFIDSEDLKDMLASLGKVGSQTSSSLCVEPSLHVMTIVSLSPGPIDREAAAKCSFLLS